MSIQTWLRLLCLAAVTGAVRLVAQSCAPPPMPSAAPAVNIFSPEQEVALGDVQAERLAHSLRVSADPVITSYIARVGNRLAAHVPATQLNFRFFVIDSPQPNAFAIAGGRIYVTRGLAAFLRTEAELAGVISHEMGHIVTHQQAIRTSLLLNHVLGVTHVSSRNDIVVKLNLLQENWTRNPGALRQLARESEGDQEAADEVALYAMTAAG